ncbi:cdc-5L [Pristionchus pacificus]|uniref:Cdc-5L n=1 Tax=Pristionchus pacificus TaxID=54126 RepID=A0A2A6BUD4_PRIPA|nr:cdc-5L [Pristionchus pacificus]|eukprot:PDM69426.1 cdc-5L [Pristionchus pacificus]
MVRVIIKGGVWRNTEDEILKAAIMKYGKNQWSRIASLLHRKSAKQCKARWFEWLDPGIKKTEWSREEDEKLLHLAKLMPTQWRTIAPIVGRTAAQCLERYEQLLDEAQRKAEGLDDEAATDARKLKPGDIDPTPETKPARPDPIDMDDDELEMLSEARARLANTQGKKAKRKARERQLSEARRLASLQKRREMRAAGLAASRFSKKRRNVLDYSAEIPFQKHVPAGFHDPNEDSFSKEDNHKKAIDDYQKPRGQQVERELRQADKDKMKRKRAEAEPEAIFAKNEKKRSKLVLPAPQISDQEMESIIKIGQASDSVHQFADGSATSGLLTDYAADARANAVASRTARTPAAPDTIMQEAQTILALQNVQTPLIGGMNTPLMNTDFSGVLPTPSTLATPNTVLGAVAATPSAVGRTPGTAYSATPGGPGATPFRDQMGINDGELTQSARHDLRRALGSLPAPKNDYEIVAPEDEENTEEESDRPEGWIEDAADVEEERAKARALRRKKEMAERSQTVQRSLPVPKQPSELALKPSATKTETSKADDSIKAQMAVLLEWDTTGKHPSTAEYYAKAELDAAKELIKAEQEAGPPLDPAMWSAVEQCRAELVLSKGKFTRLGVLPRAEQIEALTSQFQLYREWMNGRAKRTAKMEKRLKVKLGGYQVIAGNLSTKITEVRNEAELMAVEKSTFDRLAAHEAQSITKRVGHLMEEVRAQEEREKQLQKRFDALKEVSWKLEQHARRATATITADAVAYENGNGAAH